MNPISSFPPSGDKTQIDKVKADLNITTDVDITNKKGIIHIGSRNFTVTVVKGSIDNSKLLMMADKIVDMLIKGKVLDTATAAQFKGARISKEGISPHDPSATAIAIPISTHEDLGTKDYYQDLIQTISKTTTVAATALPSSQQHAKSPDQQLIKPLPSTMSTSPIKSPVAPSTSAPFRPITPAPPAKQPPASVPKTESPWFGARIFRWVKDVVKRAPTQAPKDETKIPLKKAPASDEYSSSSSSMSKSESEEEENSVVKENDVEIEIELFEVEKHESQGSGGTAMRRYSNSSTRSTDSEPASDHFEDFIDSDRDSPLPDQTESPIKLSSIRVDDLGNTKPLKALGKLPSIEFQLPDDINQHIQDKLKVIQTNFNIGLNGLKWDERFTHFKELNKISDSLLSLQKEVRNLVSENDAVKQGLTEQFKARGYSETVIEAYLNNINHIYDHTQSDAKKELQELIIIVSDSLNESLKGFVEKIKKENDLLPTDDDGNCFFDSCRKLMRDNNLATTVEGWRRAVVKELRDHPETYHDLVDKRLKNDNKIELKEKNYANYCDWIGTNLKWASEPELEAISNITKRPVIVLQTGDGMDSETAGFSKVINSDMKGEPLLFLNLAGKHYEPYVKKLDPTKVIPVNF